MKTTWTKTDKNRYHAELNGKTLTIRRERKTRSTRRKNEFGFGSHRISRTTTWAVATVYDHATDTGTVLDV